MGDKQNLFTLNSGPEQSKEKGHTEEESTE